ncbi:helix-turn-helix domain-containing protein [Pseudomonadota bacterium]
MTHFNSKNPAPQLIFDRNFDDIGIMAEAVEWDIDFRQIEAGKLQARTLLLAGAGQMVMRVEFNRKFHQRGCPPPGMMTFGFPDQKAGPLRWNGKEAQPGALLNFNDGRLDGVNPGNFGGYTLSFAEELLQEVAESLKIDIPSSNQGIPFWNPRSAEHNHLRRTLRFIERGTINPDKCIQHRVSEAFNIDLAVSIVRIIGREHAQAAQKTTPFRASVLRRALELINDTNQPPMSVSEICKTIGTSWSTLERAFAAEFGVSPKVYLQSRRLASVRQDLLKSEPDTLIVDIANCWGFWHMGRFAADYRKQFGELPSQTLQRLR